MRKTSDIDVAFTSSSADQWTAAMRRQFDVLRPLGVYVATTVDPVGGLAYDRSGAVKSAWGGPHGSRCTLVGRTTSEPWRYSITALQARTTERLRMQWRLWVPRAGGDNPWEYQDKLFDVIVRLCAQVRQYPDRNGLMLLRPDVDFSAIMTAAMWHAKTFTNRIWTDGALRRECRDADMGYARPVRAI